MPEYPVGEGRHRGRGAVVEAYADLGVLEVLCPNCLANPGEFCRHDSGNDRRIPCPRRISAARESQKQEQQ